MREIVFYQTDFGGRPVDEFLRSLGPAPRAKVVWTLELLRTQPFVPSKFWKKLPGTDDFWEVRVEYAGNIIGFWPALTEATALFCCTDSTRKHRRRRGRNWKLPGNGRSGIFRRTVTYERRPGTISRAQHGPRPAVCRRPAIAGIGRGGDAVARGGKIDARSIGKASACQGAGHCDYRGRNASRARGSIGGCVECACSNDQTSSQPNFRSLGFNSRRAPTSTGFGCGIGHLWRLALRFISVLSEPHHQQSSSNQQREC
jgi:hypothetical protein